MTPFDRPIAAIHPPPDVPAKAVTHNADSPSTSKLAPATTFSLAIAHRPSLPHNH